ncbi:MAG TPA: prepilin-type N-terminal cleavage/methylation domain-containing protein [Syntrophomonadaceae bacterium]|nr:prepilin-type N-terminal cleavage/methylation domain-containing protein [Syntrophomonadaceae bacterium]
MKIHSAIKRKKNQKGFTLIELIVVMAILAVLAAIAIPRFTSTLDKSKVKADQASLKVMNDAVEMYYADNNAYPAGTDAAAVQDTLVADKYLKETYTAQHGTFSWNATNNEFTYTPSE